MTQVPDGNGRARVDGARIGPPTTTDSLVKVAPAGSSDLDLHGYLVALRRRAWVIASVILLAVVGALVYSYRQTPRYRASSEILLLPRLRETILDSSGGQASDPQRDQRNAIHLLYSSDVDDEVRRLLGTVPGISASALTDTDILSLAAVSTNPTQAARAANAYANAFITVRRKQTTDDILAASKEVQVQIDSLQKQIDAVSASLPSVTAQERSQSSQDPRLGALLSQQLAFKQKQDQLSVDVALQAGGAQLARPAPVPKAPFSPLPQRDGLLAAALGLVLGIGIALLLDVLDQSIRTKDDLTRATAPLPVLALIPAVRTWYRRDDPFVASVADPTSPAAESYRSLRTSVQLLGLSSPVRVLQVTSPSTTEGKTTTVANLAVAMADAGAAVAALDCDLRRPRLHDFFGLDNGVGLTSVLLGDVPLGRALQRVAGVGSLLVLASGPLPPNPSEWLASPRAAEVLDLLRASADMVVIDCPPLLPVTDAAALSARVDATLLVVSAGTTTRKEASRAVELLDQVGAKTIGTVLNGMKAEPGYRYHYGYAPYRHDDATRVQNGGKRIRIGNVPEEASEAAVEQPTSEWTTGREGV